MAHPIQHRIPMVVLAVGGLLFLMLVGVMAFAVGLVITTKQNSAIAADTNAIVVTPAVPPATVPPPTPTPGTPVRSTRTARATTQARPVPGLLPTPIVRTIALAANDLVPDPLTKRVYASVPGSGGEYANSIVMLDPITGAIGAPIPVGSEPNRLAISDDGRYLYVALDGSATIRRVDIAAQRADSQVSLASDTTGNYLPYAEDLAVLPGNAEVVVVARMRRGGFTPRHLGVVVFANGKRLPNETALLATGHANSITFCAGSAVLYGLDNESSGTLSRFIVDATGVYPPDRPDSPEVSSLTSNARAIVCDKGLIYSSSGEVIDPETKQRVGSYPGVPKEALVRPNATLGRTFFLSMRTTSPPPGTPGAHPTTILTLHVYDQQTFKPLGNFVLPGVSGKPSALVRWGDDGLAFRTDAGQVVLVQVPFFSGRTGVQPKWPAMFLLAGWPLASTLVAGLMGSWIAQGSYRARFHLGT